MQAPEAMGLFFLQLFRVSFANRSEDSGEATQGNLPYKGERSITVEAQCLHYQLPYQASLTLCSLCCQEES